MTKLNKRDYTNQDNARSILFYFNLCSHLDIITNVDEFLQDHKFY